MIDGRIKSMFELGCIPTVIQILFGESTLSHFTSSEHLGAVSRVRIGFEKVVDRIELQSRIDEYNKYKIEKDKIFVFNREYADEVEECESEGESKGGHGCLLAVSIIMLAVGAVMLFAGLRMKHKYSATVDSIYRQCTNDK